MTPREALDQLKMISPILEHVPYDEIMSLLKDSVRKIPLSLAKLPAGTNIDRARQNKGEALYTSVYDELSYIRNQNVIDNFLTEYGRANKPHQPMFYGALESTLVGTQRVTAIGEVSALFQNRNGVSLNGELYTISRWRNTVELTVVEIVFAQKAIDTNPDIKKAFEKQTAFAAALNEPDIDFFQEFLIFISEEFAREKKTHNDYKISTAYTELALSNPEVQGITYPSVQLDLWGQNIVFSPAIVDQYLEIHVLSTQRLYKNKLNTFGANHKNCLNPKDCHDNIIWTDLDPQYMSPYAEILAHLNRPQ
ncbi:hypothetical protein GWC95_15785 [Sediminibacterium roseum]|uniref:RES domain-containing protein n=1 Tax=Sediminibacterium roseum TaxID=1978412 RepID=A0ABW9ZY00_9BACT|nr:hypothetical protein [Sediminibacterium roseum]NCI51390.1 hypothetical protein [Sediminibacterium roseum]